MTIIDQWTGRQAHALRAALRLTNEAFAEHLGISPRTVSKWRQRPDMVPSQPLQEALDTSLARAPDEAKTRFAANLGEPEQHLTLDQASLAQLNAAVTDLARLLSRIEFGALGQASTH
jgi:transcriptional regulator with XRE-family HTH domain